MWSSEEGSQAIVFGIPCSKSKGSRDLRFVIYGNCEVKGLKHVFMMNNDPSTYSWRQSYNNTDNTTTMIMLTTENAAFQTMIWMTTDMALHLTTSTIEILTQRAGISHHIPSVHCPFSKPAIDSSRKEVLNAKPTLLFNSNQARTKLPPIVERVLATIIHSWITGLGRRKRE